MCLLSCGDRVSVQVEEGVSKILADGRSQQLQSISYDLSFDIPKISTDSITGKLKLAFKTNQSDSDVVLDFESPSIQRLIANGDELVPIQEKGHLILPASYIKKGYNELEIDFVSGDEAFNRNQDYLYTLFVPNHASTAFPCFDQPDLKARFRLRLNMPSDWKAISNTAVVSESVEGDKKIIQFDQTFDISTYLFSFVAGDFDYEQRSTKGFDLEILHREEPDDRLRQNLYEITQLHKQSVEWMENYTGIAYPFQKFGIAILPSFQFGGMEHPGAIDYRASLLMLEESATQDDKLRRAGLIAHETVHMWFGNCVTMKWFDDVWMKEVFANYLADKIVAEMFPDINHDLVFLYDHYPSAYEVDRSSGATPIRQPLDNLDDAANMYGSIIYHKAPIMMRQLEMLVGDKVLQSSLKDYLDSYEYKSADWEDLITIIARVSGKDLSVFNQSWVYQEGMPFFELKFTETDALSEYDIIQHDPKGKGRIWPQYSDIIFSDDLGVMSHSLMLDQHHYILPKVRGTEDPKFILMNSEGKGYGVFFHGLQYVKNEFLFKQARVDISRYKNELVRGSAYINLHEYLLQEGFHPQLYFQFLQNYLREEQNEVIITYLLSTIQQVYFQFFTHEMRIENAENIENLLLTKIESTESGQLKTTLFNAYMDVALSTKAIDNLKKYWEDELLPTGITVSKRQRESIAMNIAMKGSSEDEVYVDWQIEKMENSDRIDRMKFIQPALSHDQVIRDQFFESLKYPANRLHEPWVLSALAYLHHPYRQEASIAYLKPSLEMLAELQQTGDIFFSKGWMNQTLAGYNSTQAADIVRAYLSENQLSSHLRNKLLQSSDILFRSEKNLKEYQGN
ncbi:M1 family aminopeptidase [Reichenbachiella agarivorans]|uniref:Aminopeptidase N n=1 Tax=Reichenbachiella agarivorans TaxID=2979464 RepID=A0ABY6CLF7_9BACT|nr:M1 family aminopeptidase [Reichenbachiella agarivorans]UXP31356.1 M1 family aminopeptidase [Reichenbachiella agarivorans]